jgi:beta-lactam-binding protein with PASTA domain
VLANLLASPAAAATASEVKFAPPKLEIPEGPVTIMPDLKGYTIRQVLNILNRSGLHCRFEGSGMAVSQEPAPGTAITPGATCAVKFGSNS